MKRVSDIQHVDYRVVLPFRKGYADALRVYMTESLGLLCRIELAGDRISLVYTGSRLYDFLNHNISTYCGFRKRLIADSLPRGFKLSRPLDNLRKAGLLDKFQLVTELCAANTRSPKVVPLPLPYTVCLNAGINEAVLRSVHMRELPKLSFSVDGWRAVTVNVGENMFVPCNVTYCLGVRVVTRDDMDSILALKHVFEVKDGCMKRLSIRDINARRKLLTATHYPTAS